MDVGIIGHAVFGANPLVRFARSSGMWIAVKTRLKPNHCRRVRSRRFRAPFCLSLAQGRWTGRQAEFELGSFSPVQREIRSIPKAYENGLKNPHKLLPHAYLKSDTIFCGCKLSDRWRPDQLHASQWLDQFSERKRSRLEKDFATQRTPRRLAQVQGSLTFAQPQVFHVLSEAEIGPQRVFVQAIKRSLRCSLGWLGKTQALSAHTICTWTRKVCLRLGRGCTQVCKRCEFPVQITAVIA